MNNSYVYTYIDKYLEVNKYKFQIDPKKQIGEEGFKIGQKLFHHVAHSSVGEWDFL